MAPLISTDTGTPPSPEADPERPTPSRLYKYKPLTDETSRNRLRCILVDSHIYFPSRLDFNDPFDCLVPSFLNVNGRDLRRFLSQRLKRMGLVRRDARAMAGKVDLERLRNCIQSDVDKAGMLSLTERPENLLMWGHYSSSHTGVCLEFAVSADEPFFGRAQPVVYLDKRPTFNPKGTEEENVEAALLTKSPDWKYESEWRIIDQYHGKANCSFPSERLTGIVFGRRVCSADRQQIPKWVSEKGLKLRFYDAALNEREWKLDVVPDR